MKTFRRNILIWFIASLLTSCSCSKSECEGTDCENAEGDTTSGGSTDENMPLELSAPLNFDDGVSTTSLQESPLLTWNPLEGAASYEVALGTSLGATDVQDWLSAGSNSSYRMTGLNLTNGVTYFASVRGVTSENLTGAIASGDGFVVAALVCPENFVLIPGNETPGLGGAVYTEGTKTRYDWGSGTPTSIANSAFCIMKYEAKLEINGVIQPDGDDAIDEIDLSVAGDNVEIVGSELRTKPGGQLIRPVSTHEGKPWARTRRDAGTDVMGAAELCESLGPDFELTNNSHWQAIARNIESVSENFNATLGTNSSFNRGHSDNDPAAVIPASALDSEGCVGIVSNGDPDDDCGGVWHPNKRTHTLSNGEVIWDFAGNVDEWMRDNNLANQAATPQYFHENVTYLAGINAPYDASLKWGPDPSNDYTSYTGTNEAGLGRGFLNAMDGAVLRGGSRFEAGLYHLELNYAPDHSTDGRGFRCVMLFP